jgi:hypothetical protein
MSKQYPECPLYNHATCKELHNPKSCAIIRDDKVCFKKQQKPKKKLDSDTNQVPEESTQLAPEESTQLPIDHPE